MQSSFKKKLHKILENTLVKANSAYSIQFTFHFTNFQLFLQSFYTKYWKSDSIAYINSFVIQNQ